MFWVGSQGLLKPCRAVSWFSPHCCVKHLMRTLGSMVNRSCSYFSCLSRIISSHITSLFCQNCPKPPLSFQRSLCTSFTLNSELLLNFAFTVHARGLELEDFWVSSNPNHFMIPWLNIIAWHVIDIVKVWIYADGQGHTLHSKFKPVVIITWFGSWWR